jgi:NADH:ubiquinone oxidoreductase subunit 6 (subunit J)
MIIWKGWGILAVLITFAIMLLADVGTGAVFGDTHYYDAHNWPKGAGFLLSGIIVYFVGVYLNSRPGRAMIDKATGREIVLRRVHSLFFIPMEYWGAVLAVAGIVLFFVHVD